MPPVRKIPREQFEPLREAFEGPLSLRTLLDTEAKEKSLVSKITPGMIEEMIEQKVREMLEQGKEKWKMKNQTTPPSKDGRT